LPCANPDPKKIDEYIRAGLLRVWDLGVKAREVHDKKMQQWREKNRPKVAKLSTISSIKHRYVVCEHPKAKLVLKEKFTRSFEVVPPCPHCGEKNTLFLETSELETEGKGLKKIETYRCKSCDRTVSPQKYERLKLSTKIECPKCGSEVRPQKEYPWMWECTAKGCHEVFPPSRKEELRNLKIEYYPQSIVGSEIMEGEDEIDGDLYECPIYGGVKRPRWDYHCKHYCGYREVKFPED